MNDKLEVLALIPVRSGSKGIPGKNIRDFAGHPLMAHSIMQAKAAKAVNRILVSTDAEAYREIAVSYGAEAPFLRPPELASDHATDLQVFLHALDWLKRQENYQPDICVHLRATTPVRTVKDIDSVVQLLLSERSADSVRSVSPAPYTPYKMWLENSDNTISPATEISGQESHSMPRQQLPKVYLQNAAVDAFRTDTLLRLNSMVGQKVFPYVMYSFYDIDTVNDYEEAELAYYLLDALFPLPEDDLAYKLKPACFCFDIDGVIAEKSPENNYHSAKPIHTRIKLINALHAKGHRIVLHTARGSVTGLDWREVTVKHLQEWGVLYHELLFGKPAADYYIDDRAIRLPLIDSIFEIL